jgi:Cytidine and deoxycytidylate deaminase zinc-binding region
MAPDEIFSTLEAVAVGASSGHARLAAAIVHRGKILSVGINRPISHPFQSRFSKNPQSIMWHAETAAVHNALRTVSESFLKKCTLFISRVKYTDSSKRVALTGLSAPCTGCHKCLDFYGIRSIYHSMDGTPEFRRQYKFLSN